MVRKKELEQTVYDYIIERINNKEFVPQEHIKEMEISKALNISRTPIRSAFKRLEKENIIKIVPYKGALILKPQLNNESFQERIQFLELLTTYYFQKLELKEVEYNHKPLKKAYSALKDLEYSDNNEFEEQEVQLWNLILMNSENSYIKGSVIDTLRTVSPDSGRIQAILKSSRKNKLKHYRQLIQYLADNDYPLARRELRIMFNQINLNIIQGI